tara:strand:+ start:1460 stop:1714 length:255 start_codon:yes stop_codon:yes gene_type:complete
MNNKEIIIKKIIYRSSHRGSKEMDLLLGKFVKKIIKDLSYSNLKELEKILEIEDEVLFQWFFNKKDSYLIPNNKISQLLRDFKL